VTHGPAFAWRSGWSRTLRLKGRLKPATTSIKPATSR